MTVARTWWLATAALILGAAPALAQSVRPVLPDPTAGARETSLDVGVVTTYESNVARSSAAVAAQRGIKPQDVSFRPTLNALISRPIGRETIFLSGAFGYDDYVRNHSLNSENIQFNAGALGRFSICQGSLVGSYSRQQRSLADLALVGPGGGALHSQRDIVQDANIAFSTTCGHSIGFAPTFSASHSWSNNSLAVLRSLDAETSNVSGGIAYRNPVLGSLTTFGQYSHTLYPNRPPIAPGPGQRARPYTYDTFGGGVTYARAIGSRLAGSATLSYTDLQSSAGTGGFSGFTYAVDLNYQVTPRIGATVRFERATQPTNRPNSTFEVTELYLGQVNYKMGPRLTWSAGYSHSHDRYGGIILPVFNDLTQETTDSEFGTVQFALNRRISTGISVTHLARAANFSGLSYSDFLASFNIRVKLR